MKVRFPQISEGQWKILLDYMEDNPIFAKGNCGDRNGHEAKRENSAQWKLLACKLNSVEDGCTRDYVQWRSCWNSAKFKAQKKACTMWKQLKYAKNGNHLRRYYLLTRKEKRVLTCLGIPIPAQLVKVVLCRVEDQTEKEKLGVEERSAQALQGTQANTEFCAGA